MKEWVTPRERTEELERGSLSPWAARAAETKGRDRHEEPDAVRTVFQQDRERIVGSDAFARLAAVAAGISLGAPATTTLVTTLQVAEAARTLARALRLNEDLADAIAVGLHLGDPPFGRAGGAALAGIAGQEFHTGEQALRVVERPDAEGGVLNLTFETRDGIVSQGGTAAATMEGQLVAALDRFVRLSQDLDVGLAAGIVPAAEVPTSIRMLGSSHAQRLVAFTEDVVSSSGRDPAPSGSDALGAACDELARWTAERIERHPAVLSAAERAVHCLRSIAVYQLEGRDTDPADVVDAICSLTDAGALRLFEQLFLPSPQGR